MSLEKCYTMAQASQQLPDIVTMVEQGYAVELTRHGKPVAMVVSMTEYRTLHDQPHRDFWQALQEFRHQYAHDLLDGDDVFGDVRETTLGRGE